MNDQFKAKAAVEWIATKLKHNNEPFFITEKDQYVLDLLRPVAGGTHVIISIDELKKLHDQISIVGGDMRALETVSKMIAAAKEGE